MPKEPVEVALVSDMQPCLIITAGGVFRVKDGKMKEIEPDRELRCPTGSLWEKNRAFWLAHALDKEFDPGTYAPEGEG